MIFFHIAGNNEKKNDNNNYNEKKIMGKKIVFGLLPSYIVENKIKLYCNIKILLQAIGCRKIFVLQGLRRDYIAM